MKSVTLHVSGSWQQKINLRTLEWRLAENGPECKASETQAQSLFMNSSSFPGPSIGSDRVPSPPKKIPQDPLHEDLMPGHTEVHKRELASLSY